MANLKSLRTRITSVSSTMQITSAMKMVSAAKLKRAQDQITRMRPYAQKLQGILSNVSASLDASEGVFSAQREVKRVLLVAITSNRGLCGAFNANVIKASRREMARLKREGVEASVVTIGKKAFDLLRKDNAAIKLNASEVYNHLSYDSVAAVANQIMDGFQAGEYDEVTLIYNQFKNAAVQVLQVEPYLPMVPAESAQATSSDYLFEPAKQAIVEDLIPLSLRVQLYKAVLDSNASEHGARMTAMHKATDNAKSLQKSLKLEYNKARQAAITNEILEIVGGAEALKG
jgi:F-type H+-transporting ATPase subunit gamma